TGKSGFAPCSLLNYRIYCYFAFAFVPLRFSGAELYLTTPDPAGSSGNLWYFSGSSSVRLTPVCCF
ncbi:MAG: hypothetical protein CVU89_09010, partial [Firmicutes bacterium HGW-Firmicutes-14]